MNVTQSISIGFLKAIADGSDGDPTGLIDLIGPEMTGLIAWIRPGFTLIWLIGPELTWTGLLSRIGVATFRALLGIGFAEALVASAAVPIVAHVSYWKNKLVWQKLLAEIAP